MRPRAIISTNGGVCSAIPMNDDIPSALLRRERIADMMLTAHATLRDRYAARALVLDVLTLLLATVLCATVFVDPAVLTSLHVTADSARVVLGVTSIAVFLASILTLRLDWKERAARHNVACTILAGIKARCRDLRSGAGTASSELPEFLRASAEALNGLPAIPEKRFVALKARHRFKVELSRMLDKHPTVPTWLARLYLRVQGSWRLVTSRGDASEEA